MLPLWWPCGRKNRLIIKWPQSTCYWRRNSSYFEYCVFISHLSSCRRMQKVHLSRHTKELLCQLADKTAFVWLLAWTLLQLWKKNAPSRHPVWWIQMEVVKTPALLPWEDLSTLCSLLFLVVPLLLRLFSPEREYETFLFEPLISSKKKYYLCTTSKGRI